MTPISQGKRAIAIVLCLATTFSACSSTPAPSTSTPISSDYSRYRQEPFNQPSHYPIDPVPHAYSDYYHPVGEWTGRLILPQRSERQPEEFVWFEIHNAPENYGDWIGRWAKLQWQDDPDVQAYVDLVTTDIQFSDAARESQNLGRVHPTRLNSLENVGPLESLAGARPADDVRVMLRDPVVQQGVQRGELDHGDEDTPVLAIAQEPVQITGRWQGLVQILNPIESLDGESDRFSVRHFNKDTQTFDGPIEPVRIPQAVPTVRNIYPSTTDGIQDSPLNDGGWYVYGDRDTTGTFVVQAIEPRQLTQLDPDEVLLTQQDGLDYIRNHNWANVPQQKGTGSTTLIAPVASTPDAALAQWTNMADDDRETSADAGFDVGTRAIALHVFGGIGGENAEPKTLWTTTGHFSYGIAEVIQDPLTDQPRFWIEYHQVYAHNPNGIVSGAIHWSDYMGNLQRGWLGNRPVSDVLIQLDTVTEPYLFGDITIDPLDEFVQQLNIMTARYRTGNGTGAAIVTPATSCVQDSNQALYATIRAIEQQVSTSREVQAWLEENPNHPQRQRFRELVQLGDTLDNQLAPLGFVRSDWKENAAALSGIEGQPNWTSNEGILPALQSWRTLLPRRAHDEISRILLVNDASLWFIRTNQIGGNDPTILPLAPTTFLGF